MSIAPRAPAATATTTATRYTLHRNPQIAAAISYHVLFAVVPLFIFLGTIFGLLLRDDERRQEVTEQLVDRFPLSPEAGVDSERILSEIPTPFSVIGVLSILALLWSASGMMSSVRVGLTGVFDGGQGRPFFHSKLVDVILVFSIAGLFVGLLALTIAINAVERWSETVADRLGAEGFAVWHGNYYALEVMQRLGLEPEGRKYIPHVTLARLRDTSSWQVADYLSARGHFRSAAFEASRFVLFSSRSSVGGGPYVVEAAYPLGAPELRYAQL